MWIRNLAKDPGWKKFGPGIRDKLTYLRNRFRSTLIWIF
jgi:hypothetical protein